MDETAPSLPMVEPHIESLRVRKFRALRDFELRDLTRLTAFVGPNGSGKSTVFDVFAFLHQAFTSSLKQAVESRFGMRELRTRGEEGPIEIELTVRFPDDDALLGYEIAFDEQDGKLVVVREWGTALELHGMGGENESERILSLSFAKGWVYEVGGVEGSISLREADDLAAPLVGRIGSKEWFIELIKFINDWYPSDIDATHVQRIPEAGPQERVSPTDDNVANVLEWLSERHPDRLETIYKRLRAQIPRLESISPVKTGDGRFMLQL